MKVKKNLIRGGIAAAWLLLGAVLFVTNRGHTLLVDNRNVELPQIQAPQEISVSLDGGKAVSFFRGDRDRFTLAGSKHRIRVEFTGGRPPFEETFTLPIRDDMYLLSVPKLLSGVEPFVEVFHTVPESRIEEEELPADEIGEEAM